MIAPLGVGCRRPIKTCKRILSKTIYNNKGIVIFPPNRNVCSDRKSDDILLVLVIRQNYTPFRCTDLEIRLSSISYQKYIKTMYDLRFSER